MPRVYSMRAGAEAPPPGAIRVDRATPYGNHLLLGRDGDRAEVLAKYTAWAMDDARAEWRARVRRDLVGADLVCWCHPRACHADILLAIANGTPLPGVQLRM